MTPEELIAALPEKTRATIAALDSLIKKNAPSFAPYVAGKMLGYGKYRYRYRSREGVPHRRGAHRERSQHLPVRSRRGRLARRASR